MAEMNFFFTIKEREDFVKFCFGIGCSIVPDVHYEDDSYMVIKTFDQYLECMNECVGFFIVHEKYNVYPLEMDFFEKNNTRKYYITQRCGGPTIDFFSPILAEKKRNKIGPGLISTYPFYYHFNEKFIPNEELKKMYNLLTLNIRQRSKKVKIGLKNYWIGDYAFDQFKNDKLDFVEIGGLDWTPPVPANVPLVVTKR